MKYRNKKSGGYDSKLEKRRGQFLELLEKSGKIQELRKQVKFVLQEPFRCCFFGQRITGEYKKGGGISYYADFVYKVGNHTIIEDCKGFKTQVYILKRAMLLKIFGNNPQVSFFEVAAKDVETRFY